MDGAGRAGGGDPALREAKKAELATWLASEIEVCTCIEPAVYGSVYHPGSCVFVPSLAELKGLDTFMCFGGLQVMI